MILTRWCCRVLVASGLSILTAAPVTAQIDERIVRAYFEDAKALCERDGGRLWGVSLCGPMVFADPATGQIVTSQPAPTAARPPALGFVNAPLPWGGTRWSAYIWSPDFARAGDQALRRLWIHELFHRVQPDLKLMVFGQPNAHLDTLDGRYWLRLEWRALAKALASAGPARAEALCHAVAFRRTRREHFPAAAENERVLEIREGLAEYTGTVVAAGSPAAAAADAVRQLTEREKDTSFVSTFAYPSGAAYGVLLDAFDPGWTRRLAPGDDLGALVVAAAKLTPCAGTAQEAARRYDGEALRRTEESRDVEQRARVAALRQRLVDGPVLIVPRGSSAAVTTTGATPIPGAGTVFFGYRVTTDWGSVESTSGLLDSSDGKTLRLPAPFTGSGQRLVGDGWTATISAGWIVRPAARPGDAEVVRAAD